LKEVVDFLVSKKLTFRSFKSIETKSLGSTKKIKCYFGVDLKSYFIFFIEIKRKGRVLVRDVEEFIQLHHQMELLNESKINHKYIHIQAPLCSKAKKSLLEKGWIVWHSDLV